MTLWRTAAQASVIGIFILVLGVVLYFARPLLLPVLSAFAVGMTVGPLTNWLGQHGVPGWVAALATVVLLIGGVYLAAFYLTQPTIDLIARAPEIGTTIKDKFSWIDRPLNALRDLQAALPETGRQTVVVSHGPTELLGSLVGILTPALMQVLLFFVTLFFFLAGRSEFRNYLVRMFTTRDARLRTLKALNEIERNLSQYLLTVTFINLGLGVAITLMTWVIGLPTPLLWGVLAFVLNFVPYVGPAFLHLALFVMALLTFPTLAWALLTPALSIAITTVEGQIMTPNILGRRFEMSPLMVFLAVAFWAWLWGPIGAFMAMPLLIAVDVTLHHLYPDDKLALPE